MLVSSIVDTAALLPPPPQSLTPRQISILANHSLGNANNMQASSAADAEAGISYGDVSSTLQSIPSAYLARRMGSSSCAADMHHHVPHKHKDRNRCVLHGRECICSVVV